MRRWSFHTVALASGGADEELAAKKELLARLRADTALSSWQRSCSFRVVGRAQLEELVRATHAEETEARRREERKVLQEAAGAGEGDAAGDAEEDKEDDDVKAVVVTPALLALAFQRLVARDKREFLAYPQSDPSEAEGASAQAQYSATEKEAQGSEEGEQDPAQPPARVYLLVDFPTSLAEVTALLRLGEVASASQVADGPENLPLVPLIDGVVLLADPSAARGRNRSSSTNVPRNRGGSVVEGGTSRMPVMETTAFQTSNAVVKLFYEAAQVGGIEWSDFTFTNIDCGATTAGTKSTEELEKEIISTVEAIAAQKFAFKNWVASTRFCAIPTSPGDDGALYEQYESVLDGVFPGSIAVSTVLFAVAEAVATLAFPPMKLPSCSRNQDASSNLEEFVEYGDIVGFRIASAQLFHEALQADGDPCFVATGHRIDDIERTMWRRSDFPGVGNEGRKAMPRTPQLSEPERSVRNTELATFYESPRFSSWMVHLTRQLLQVEDLLGNSWGGRLQSRVFMEYLPRTILPQRIASVLQQNTADIYSSYYPATDSLLMACLPSTAPGRLRSTSWVARDHVRHRPPFKDWKQKLHISNEYLTPRSEAAAAACVPLSAGQLELVATQSWSMYPADHSVVRLCQTPRGSLWLTVYLHGETFGLRLGAEHFSANGDNRGESTLGPSLLLDRKIHFIASFQDESTLHISEGKRRLPNKPDKFPTVAATNSFPNGLIVSACSDGSIIQRYSHSTQNINNKGAYNASSGVNNAGVTTALQHEEEREVYRVIYGRGSVLRVLQCGRKEVLLANGITRVVQDCKTHRHDSRRRACNDAELPPPLATTLTVDPETNALVERRPNGVIIVTLTSGARVTYHADGTGMYLNAGNTHVLVKKRGFADVCIDVDVNITAQHHSAGERVAVTKGGLRVRSVVDVYDGTRVEISYNTKVTAQVNGRVTTRKPSGQIVVAKDSGRVEYISPGSMKNPAGPDSKDDDDRDVTSHNGVYYFDCRQGHFQLCDNEQNQFRVEFNGTDKEGGPSVAVNLAGVVSDAEAARYEVDAIPAKAVINEPIPPHVFVLNGDGSGVEIPRPQDIAGYIEGVATENQVGKTGKTGGAQLSTTRSHVFLRHLRDSRPPTPIFNDAQVHAEMLGLQQPVATAAKYLPRFFAEAKITTPSQQFTTVRRIQQIEPLSADELLEMHAGWTKWEQWQEEREANKECYKVVDPRQPEVIAQEVAMQKKVLAAYKATRARKKLARQKAREMKAKNGQELSPGLRMETVQEGEETLGDEGEGESDDEFGQFGSDMSDDDVGETAEVDDPMELLWSAFSQADTEGKGLLSIAQTRLGVVNVLGIGVTANELTEALVRFKIPYPFNVSFDVFADLVAFFRSGDESNQDSEEPSSDQGSHIPSLKGMAPAQRKGHGTPRGSAAEAIRARHLDGGSMSC